MLEAYRDGLANEEVFRAVLNSEVDDFSDRFFAYLEERFARPLDALARGRIHEGQPSTDELRERAEGDPEDFLAQLGYGHLLAEQGRHQEAVPYLERAKASFPEFAGAGSPYHYLAAIHRERGDLERAEAELAALTAINERDLEANLVLAEVREARGDPRGAAEALERIVYIYPYDPDLHVRLAELYRAAGDLAGAVRERRAVVALDPVDRVEALYRLGRAYYEAGDLTNARSAVLRALENAPLYEAAQNLLLEIHSRKGGG
jgi:tetratricopeptide (TPR) repeat protein